MIRILWLSIFVMVLGCQHTHEKKIASKSSPSTKALYKPKNLFLKDDLPGLVSYPDTSQFIGRLVLVTHYGDVTVIQMTDKTDHVNLCVNQMADKPAGTNKGDHPASNQHCYRYDGIEARRIRFEFLRYNSHTITDKTCDACIYHSTGYFEVFDHGNYSFYRQDSSYVKQDEVSINYILAKAHVNLK